MKKLYTTLALAAAVAFGASAAAPKAAKTVDLSNAKVIENVDFGATLAAAAPQKAPQKADAKVPTNMEELCDMYLGEYYARLESLNGWQEVGVTLSPVEGEANQVEMVGLLGNFPIKGTVDFNAKTISFPRQDVYFHPNYNKWVYLCWQETKVSGTSVEQFETDKPVVFSFADGNLTCPSGSLEVGGNKYVNGCVALRIDLGYFFLGSDFTLERFVIPDFDLEGWTKAGTCSYLDAGWVLNGLFGYDNAVEMPGLEAEYYTKEMLCDVDEEMHTYLAVYQPYGKFNAFMNENLPNWVEEGIINTSNATGAVVLDITYPECVMAMQNYYSGMQLEGEYYWNYNQEYLEFYQNDFTADDIVGAFDEVSTYDKDANVIEITNCLFGINSDKYATYQWTDREGNAIPTLALITLTPGGESGLNTVITDNNAPVEYYNLQGVRVADDAKGLVIRKQGNNVAKVIR
ncbi:MAG: hypothetical protein K2G35_01355 [Duncaniella sp.]|nr:hypothetical protein [Duncaniella sp.]